MFHAHVSFPRYVGTAPGTTAFSTVGRALGSLSELEPSGTAIEPLKMPPVPAPYGHYYPQVEWLDQSIWVDNPNLDNVQMLVPPNQWVEGPLQLKIDVPKAQAAMGPVPTDLELAKTRPYLPYHKGFIATKEGDIFNLQGAGVGANATLDERALKWGIIASVMSATALATTTLLAVLRYREEKRR
jgi:hypothetical protein